MRQILLLFLAGFAVLFALLLSNPILVLRHMAETMRRKRRNAHAG